MKKLRQIITSVLPAILLLLLIGAGAALAHYRDQQITQRFQPETGLPSPSPRNTPKKISIPTPSPVVLKPTTTTQKPASNLITCVGADGKQLGQKVTKEECDSFNSAWNNNPKPAANTQPSQKRVEINVGQQQPPCTVGSYTYYYTDPATCARWQQEQKDFEKSLNNIQYIFTPTTMTTTTQPDNTAAKEACKASAQSKYNSAVAAAQTYGGNVQTAALEIASNDLSYALGQCENL
jgi:hypothetical protein